ncbi:uncharacterized protein LOC135494330 [Lineus longissimus]|uniref:uncharacterized protein LOC135494330 n=1 Tax=Lineus longissimus TaxID=88925 RepID=UPI00315D447E
MGQEKLQDSYVISGLEVLSMNGENVADLPPVFTQSCLPVTRKDVVTSADIEKYSYLKQVPLQSCDSDVGLLIGVNVPHVMQPLKVIPSQGNGPYAVQTILGWVVNGPLNTSGDDDHSCSSALVNRISVQTVQTLEEQVRDHINYDFSERVIDDQEQPSKKDKQFIRSVSESVEFIDGHYVIGLPFKDENVRMPNNRPQAVQRMESLRRKFHKSTDFHERYKTFMNKLFDNDYARVAPEDDMQEGKVWYLPHHGVFHPKKDKLRVVFDCAARYGGTSLNDQLLQGPNLTNSLTGVLLRFRQGEVAITADIESMFYRVRVPAHKDANFLRFLWWQDGDPSKPMIECQMLVLIFGAASSSSCSNYALRKTADDHKDGFAEAASTIQSNFYVDDCLKSVASTEKAIALADDLRTICDKGGFKLTAWISNDREVMATIPKELWAKGVKDLDIKQNSLPVERALGVQWCVESDTFWFRIQLTEKPPTRRGILSTVYSVYDPLGFLSPFILKAKAILQELCKLKLGWDDNVPEPYLGQWRDWLQDLPKLSGFSADRCVKPQGFGEIASAALHHFSDASETGYGVASYLRAVNAEGLVHCCLLQSKSRVAPLKQVSIVRLELTAATVAVRLNTMLR